MKVLVTGHLGYIGTILVPLLKQAGHDVVGLDSDLYEQCTFGQLEEHVFSIEKDIRDVIKEDLEGFEAIVHLAGLSNDPLGDLNPKITDEINHLATIQLGRLAKEAGVARFLFSSSCSIYGASGNNLVSEKAPFCPITPYGRSKMLAEEGLRVLADDQFSPTFLRNATVYGTSPRLRFDLVINNLMAWAMTTKRIYLKSDGTPWRPLVHVEDVARAFLTLLQNPQEKAHNEIFNVGALEGNYQIKELAEMVKDKIPGAYIEFSKDAGPDKRCYRVDCQKFFQTFPEFKTKWTPEKGVDQLYELYQDLELKLEDFEGEKYGRLAHLKYRLRKNELTSSLRQKHRKMPHIENRNV